MDSRKLSGFLYKNAQMGLYTIPMLLSISKDKRFNALLRQQYAFYRSFAKQTAKLPREKDIRLSCLEKLLDRLKAEDQVLLGVDICGECDPGAGEGYEKNDRANAALLTLPFQERFMPVQGGQENKKYEE